MALANNAAYIDGDIFDITCDTGNDSGALIRQNFGGESDNPVYRFGKNFDGSETLGKSTSGNQKSDEPLHALVSLWKIE